MKTEWGVNSSLGGGIMPVKDYDSALTITENMHKAGHAAVVVWRGVTEWREHDSYDD